MPGAGLFDVFGNGFNRLDGDAIDRTDPFALRAANAIVHIHEQLHA